MIDARMHFLTDSELEFYTGYIQPAAQIRFLRKWNVQHVVNALGRPIVTWDAINRRDDERPKRARKEPNFAALNRAV